MKKLSYNIKIKQAIEDLDISQRILADVSGVHESTLSLVIRGTYPTSKSMKGKICEALGMTEAQLFG